MRTTILLAALATVLASCQKDADVQNNSSASTDLYPLTKGSTWEFSSAMLGKTSTSILQKDSSINGKTYVILSNSNGVRSYMRKDGTVYSTYGISASGNVAAAMVLLKDEAVGASWAWSVNNQGTMSDYNFKIKNIGLSRIVAGKLYKDVVEVEYSQKVTGPGLPAIDAGTGTQFYARGVGPIEVISNLDFFGMTVRDTSRLLSYSIK